MTYELPSLAAVAQALNQQQTSAQALLEQCLSRASDPGGEGGRVFTRLFEQQARAQASASDQLRSAKLLRSPLEGIPVAVKDLFDIAGYTTRAASKVLNDAALAHQDAVIVQRLRQAGAVIVGTTNMSEFAFSGLGLNPHYGTPKNPWDRQTGRIPGGSSSGSAVAVADGMAVAAIGTDTGGSVRIPAALCGLTGFKPTARRIDQTGTLPLSFSLDSIGPIAPSVSCCATLDAVMAGEKIEALVASSPQQIVLGIPEQMFFDGMDDHVAGSFERARQMLETAGIRMVAIDFPELDELAHINQFGGFTAAESWAWHESLLQSRGDEYDRRVAVRIRRGAQQSAADYIRLSQARASWIARVTQKLAGIDAILTPTVPRVAPAIAPLEVDDDLFMATNMLMLRNTSVINFLDGCSLSIPCHEQNTAPVGMMLSSTAGRDKQLLQVGLACEQILQRTGY